MRIYGSITIDFVANTTERNLLDNFNDYLVKIGVVSLTNMNNEELRLQIDSHEITYLDEEDAD